MSEQLSAKLIDVERTVGQIAVRVDLLENLAESVIHLNDVDNLLEEIAGMPAQIQQARINVGRTLEKIVQSA